MSMGDFFGKFKNLASTILIIPCSKCSFLVGEMRILSKKAEKYVTDNIIGKSKKYSKYIIYCTFSSFKEHSAHFSKQQRDHELKLRQISVRKLSRRTF